MPLVKDTELHRIPIEGGAWIDVKARLSRYDRIKVEQAVVGDSQVVNGAVSAVSASQAIEAAEYALLEIVIRAWSFEDAITPETIRELSDDDMDTIKDALNNLYPVRDEDTRKNSSGSGAPHLSAVVPLREGSTG